MRIEFFGHDSIIWKVCPQMLQDHLCCHCSISTFDHSDRSPYQPLHPLPSSNLPRNPFLPHAGHVWLSPILPESLLLPSWLLLSLLLARVPTLPPSPSQRSTTKNQR